MKRLFNIIIILSILGVLGIGGLWFGYSAILAKQNEETVLRRNVASEKQKAKAFAAARRTAIQAEKEVGELRKYFYDAGEESQIDFVSQVEALGALTSGARIVTKSLDLTAGETPSFHGEFSVKGSWEEMYYFLRLIETFPAHIIINRFAVGSTERESASVAVWTGGVSIDLVSLKNQGKI